MMTSIHTVTVEINVSADNKADAAQQVSEWLASHPVEQPDYEVKQVED